MNSLVVLLSVMALAAAKPSAYEAGFVNYASPAVAVAPAAVSHQSRIDIKSSPAIVAESIVPFTRSVIAEPAAIAAPAAYAAPVAYTGPSAFVGHSAFAVPTAYAAPLAITAPAAISSQSRFDIKSSPAFINTFAAPVLNTIAAAPIAYSAPFAATYASSIYTPAIAPAIPLAKNVAVDASVEAPALPVAPTETPEVAAARAAHLEAKALEESHNIQKRSLGFVATAPVLSTYAATPVISSYAGPYVYPSSVTRVGTPIAVSSPVLTSAYGIHPY